MLISLQLSTSVLIGNGARRGCYDVESFIRLCCGIQADPEGSAAGLITGCLNHAPDPEDAKMLAAEANKCPPYARIEIYA